MASRREAVLAGAIDVLAAGGARQLTHRAVDAAAGLPTGSTSNVFRTRAGLIGGVLGHITDRERAGMEQLPLPPGPLDEASLVQLGAGVVLDALGAGRSYTLARRALFHEAASDTVVATELLAATHYWWGVVAELLAGAGAPEPQVRARWLLAYLDGVIADQLARPDPAFNPAASLAPAIYGLLRSPVQR